MKRFIGVISIIVAMGFVTVLTMINEEPEERDELKGLMQVHVVKVKPEKVIDRITGHGQVNPRWQTALSSEVSGRVLSVSEKFLSGTEFNQGDVLAAIDDKAYIAALKTAKSDLATAQRIFKEEQQRSKIAADNWKSSGFKSKPSGLVLRKPQLAEAQANIESAKAVITKAEYDWAQTKITAPYDGVVIERVINPGDFLQTGSLIGRVYDRSLYDIIVPLSMDDIARLPQGLQKGSVTIYSTRTNQTWSGKVSRIEQVVDPQNRWQNVVITITDTKGLLPGEFVNVEFEGRAYDKVLAIPENIPANNGSVWYVDAQHRLQNFTPDTLFRKNGILFVHAPFEKRNTLHVTAGSDAFLPDVKVEPIGGKYK
ncbi:MAG: efflux RND transporter periplasmic adaptor subunit [Alphaproteobacteria bacterium]